MPERTVRLEFSGWTPRPVVDVACTLWKIAEKQKGDNPGRTTDYQEIQDTILRLANHPSMRTVWNELRKKHLEIKFDEAWKLWLKHFGEMPQGPPWTLFDVAIALFFHRACFLASSARLMGPVAAALSQLIEGEGKDAEALRWKAQFLDWKEGKIPWSAIPGLGNLPRPSEFAALYGLDVEAPVMMQRNHGKAGFRVYVMLLAETTRALYGQKMYTMLATTANVAADPRNRQHISRDNVRNWLSRD